MDTEDRVNSWNGDAKERRVKCPLPGCPLCKAVFVFLEVRGRTFLALIEDVVTHFESWAVRWRCPLCNKRITQLPPFGVPFARYVKETVLTLAETYLEPARETSRHKETVLTLTETCLEPARETYRHAVDFKGYESQGGRIDERRISHSTLWKWVGELGGMDEALMHAEGLLRMKGATSQQQTEDPIPAHKYRSEARRMVLWVARRLIRTEREFVRVFGTSLFPNFRTA